MDICNIFIVNVYNFILVNKANSHKSRALSTINVFNGCVVKYWLLSRSVIYCFLDSKRIGSNVQLYREYCSQRNAVQRDVKFAKDNYFRRKLEESKRDYGKLCNVTGMVMIDFRKVFDTCDHSILLCKLDCMGIGPD